MARNKILNITNYNDLITTSEQTRAGFIEAALVKNRKAQPLINEAETLKVYASTANKPMDLINIKEIKGMLLTASGLSDKAFKYFSEENKIEAIKEMINNFLEPVGKSFVDELVYRFLLIKGDSLGGSMRNYVGNVAKMKLIRSILAVLNVKGIAFQILYKDDKAKNKWNKGVYDNDFENVDKIKAISWNKETGESRVVFFDTNIPLNENKNVDICLYNGDTESFDGGNIVNNNKLAIMFGELKGGIDPAGADEHWKTGNSALGRIRKNFNAHNIDVKTSFIAAAIVEGMAKEIWEQLRSKTLSFAANITVKNQLVGYCDWLINL